MPLYSVQYHALFKFRVEKKPEFFLSLSACLTQTHAQCSACARQAPAPAQKTISTCPATFGQNPTPYGPKMPRGLLCSLNTL